MTETSDAFDRHTEFLREEQHLEAVVATIDATVKHHEGRGPVYAGDAKASDIVKDLLNAKAQDIRTVRDRPYFGRIDYSTGPHGNVRTIYIGDFNISHDDPRYFIASRNAPIARLCYRPADGFFEVEKKARKTASVQLKRTLTIEDARLTSMTS